MIRKSINLKLLTGIISVLVISTLMIGVIFINLYNSSIIDSKKDSLVKRANQVSQIVQQMDKSGYPISSYSKILSLIGEASDSHIWVIDSTGKMLSFPFNLKNDKFDGSSVGRDGIDGVHKGKIQIPQEAGDLVKSIFAGKQTILNRYSDSLNETVITVGVPIFTSDGLVAGGVLLNSPVKGINDTVNKAAFILFIGIIVAIVISIAFAYFFSNYITKPIKAMNKLAIDMANGNYKTVINVTQEDEIGQLGNSLNKLATGLDSTIEQLYQEKSKLSDIVTSITEGILSVDTSGNISSYNESSLKLIGIHGLSNIEKEIKKFMADNDIHKSLDMLLKGIDVQPVIVTNGIGHLKFSFSPVRDLKNSILGAVILVQDISESEKLEQIRRDFVANVSHEFKTPLTVIRGTAEALKDKAFTTAESFEKAYERIINETKHLDRLVIDLLDLSKLEAGKLELKNDYLDLFELLMDLSKSMSVLARNKMIEIEFEPGSETLPYFGDYDRLKQFFMIFLDNAIKYSDHNTKITIGTALIQDASKEKSYEVSIKDQGYGIPKEDLPFIFDRFYKSDKSRTREYGLNSNGLGLSIAKLLIDLFKGDIDIKSEVGKGTEVTIRLPVAF